MPETCQKCQKNVTRARFPGLSCCNCKKYWHFQCAGLTQKVFKDLEDSKSLSWSCKLCNRRSNILPAAPLNDSVASTSATSSASSSSIKPTKAINKTTPTDSNKDLLVRIEALERLLTTALQRIDQLESHLSEKTLIADNLTAKVESLETKAISIEKQLTDDQLEIQGLPEAALSNPLTTAIAIGESIGCSVSEEDFACLPARDRKNISLTFKSKVKRKNFLLSGKQFNKNKNKFSFGSLNSRIHVNEILSDSQKKLYKETKTFANANNYKFVWVGVSGQIFLKKEEGHSPIIINSTSALTNHASDVSELSRTPHEGSQMSAINNAA